MKVRVLHHALEDMAAARAFYDRQEEGVGAYFFDSLFAEIDSLILHAGIHSIQFGYHRMLATRFPYAIYYRITDGVAVVHRVLDCRRDPRRIRRELGKEG